MSGLLKGLAAGLGGAAIGALGEIAKKKTQDKAAADATKKSTPSASAPSYSIAHDMRTSGSSSTSAADTQTPDTE